MPDPEPLIDNVLDQGTVALLYGRWGTGKSFIGIDWSCCVVTGHSWQARPSEQRRVLYVAAEGAFGMKGRVDAWETGWDTKVGEDLHILPRPVNLTNHAEVQGLRALIEWGGYGLVVLDTLARCMVGGDENSARDVGLVIDALTRLRQSTPGGRGTVLGVHHTGKDGKTMRGSSAFEGGVDTVYSVTRDADDGTIILDREKRKDGPESDTHRLRLDPIPGTGSCALTLSHANVRHDSRADVLLSHFSSHFCGTGASAAQLRETVEMTRATFYRALNDLVKQGDIINTGTDSRPFYKLANP